MKNSVLITSKTNEKEEETLQVRFDFLFFLKAILIGQNIFKKNLQN